MTTINKQWRLKARPIGEPSADTWDYSESVKDIAGWIQSGEIKVKEHIVKGIETFPGTLMMLFNGENFGKPILKVGE